MKLKVCGLREPENIRDILDLAPDWIGLIFYNQSKRNACNLSAEIVRDLEIKKVGVFVNSEIEEIEKKVSEYGLDFVQLHGDEDLGYVKKLNGLEIAIIKVFRLAEKLPQDDFEAFSPFVSFFLFDTLAKEFGGTGRKFDWSILANYSSDTPYLLSGGIDLEDIDEIKKLPQTGLIGIDVNSRFEISPGLKDIGKLKELKALL